MPETEIPRSAAEFVRAGEAFRAKLEAVKKTTAVADYGWYPYQSLTALPILENLLKPVYEDLAEGLAAGRVADIGCADGDLGLLCAQLGADVDLIDHLESSFNQMRGIHTLRNALGLKANVHDIDLDDRFHLPRTDYRFAFFLGTLYHLKNPYYVLEQLALHADWCVVSTRIAQVTPTGTPMEQEPVAYLLEPREANNDPTNFWIFSAAGLLRLVERTGWTVFGSQRIGREKDSDPVRPEADERMFVLLRSRPRHPELLIRAVSGFHAPEAEAWRWSAKRFTLQVVPPEGDPPREFALRFDAPEPLFAGGGEVKMTCTADGQPAGAITCARPETVEFRGRFPDLSGRRPVLLEFTVESSFAPPGDARELGVILPLAKRTSGNEDQIPFRVS